MPCDISSTISVALIEVASSNYQLAGLLTYAKSIKSLKTSRRAHLKALPERMTLQNSCRGDVQESGNPQDTHSKAGTAPSDVDDNVTTLNLLEKCKKKEKSRVWVFRTAKGLVRTYGLGEGWGVSNEIVTATNLITSAGKRHQMCGRT